MGVRVGQYGREMDKSKKSESLQERHKKAVKVSSVKLKSKKEKGESLLSKTKRRMKELFYGERTYLPGHKKQKPTKQTVRTAKTVRGLRAAGLTEAEINRLRGKKK